MTVLATDQPLGALEVVHLFHGAMPTGVSVSHSGRIFVNFPRWGDDVKFTVAEIRDGELVAYPSQAFNDCDGTADPDALVSVQSIVVDPADRLWILDTGSPMFSPTAYGGPKLVGVDLSTNKVFQKILFPQEVVTPESYVNDVRFDLRRGQAVIGFGENPVSVVVDDGALLAQFPEGYRHLAYLQTRIGYDVKKDMPGLKGAEVEALYRRGKAWLSGAASSTWCSPMSGSGHTLVLSGSCARCSARTGRGRQSSPAASSTTCQCRWSRAAV